MNHKIFRALLVGLVLALPAMAQLSGPYTIDSSMPTGGGNYASFIDAATDLTTLGVSGPTIFTVAPGAAPYSGFALGLIPGTSAMNTVTFIAAAGPKPVLSGPDAGFTFVQTVRFGTTTSISAAPGTGPSYVTFDGFEITGASSGAAFLAFGCDFVTVRNCVAHTSGSGIGLTNSYNSAIEDCEVYGTTHVPGAGGSTSYSGAIFAYYLSANNVIQRNRIHDCADNGIFVGSSGSTTATPDNIVINNFIWECGTQASATYAGGIALRRATNSIVAHNSVSMPAASLRAGIFVMTASSLAPIEISNNAVQHNGTAPCLQMDVAGYLGILDFNLYDAVGGGPVCGIGGSSGAPTTPYATLAAWQAASGGDASAVAAAAGFLLANDLHITPASAAFNAGGAVASIPGGVLVDIDGQARPMAGTNDIGADETPATGLFAGFSGTPTSGGPPLVVNFTDLSFSSAGGVTVWAWDLDGDTVVDSTTQNPTFTYNCPGSYDVTLTVDDGVNPQSTLTIPGYITVGDFVFDLATSGGGVGDLTITPIPTSCGLAMGAAQGWTLFSLDTSLGLGAGPAFGIVPDAFTWGGLFVPPAPGNLLHFVVSPGLYPDAGPLAIPPGGVAFLAGLSLDAVMVFLDGASNVIYVSNADRVTI